MCCRCVCGCVWQMPARGPSCPRAAVNTRRNTTHSSTASSAMSSCRTNVFGRRPIGRWGRGAYAGGAALTSLASAQRTPALADGRITIMGGPCARVHSAVLKPCLSQESTLNIYIWTFSSVTQASSRNLLWRVFLNHIYRSVYHHAHHPTHHAL